jgi:hypothetical protein
METKVCSKCKQELPVSEFHRYNRRSTQYYSQCRDCKAEYKRANNAKLRIAQKKRRDNPSAEDKLKKKAWNALHYALRTGKIIKPDKCDICGCASDNIQAHHDDYNKPFDVVWACQKCHSQLDTIRRIA